MYVSYLESGQILDFGQVSEFQIERVDTQKAENIDDVEEKPSNQHDDIVGKNHVIDNASKCPSYNFPWCKKAHDVKPAFEGCFLFFSQSIQKQNVGDEQNCTA